MSEVSAFGTAPAPADTALTMQTDKLLHQTASTAAENGKIDQSARDFEAILLGSWLQQAEQSFGSLPGAEADDDADAGKEQYQAIGVQALGGAMAASGGIGIARMIATQLHKRVSQSSVAENGDGTVKK